MSIEKPEQENSSFQETKDWLKNLIEDGTYKIHLGSELDLDGVGSEVWKLVEAFRRNEFSGEEGFDKFDKMRPNINEQMSPDIKDKDKLNKTEKKLIAWIGNALFLKLYNETEENKS